MFKKSICTAAFLAAAALTGAAHADVITFNLNQPINGAVPADSKPWLTATVTDLSPGVVEIEMKNYLSANEYVYDWLFNTSVTSAVTGTYKSGFKGVYAYGATDGGSQVQAGVFDISFACSSSNCPNNAPRFTGGMTSVYDLSGTGLTAASFLTLSGVNGYYTVADVRGLTGTTAGSGSIGTNTYTTGGTPPFGDPLPEPMPLALLGMGLVALAAARKKKSA